jgi:hypothetical protein
VLMEKSKTSDGDQKNASKSRSAMPTNLLEKVVQGRLLVRTLKLPISGMRDANTNVGMPRFCVSMDYPISCQAGTFMLLRVDLAS